MAGGRDRVRSHDSVEAQRPMSVDKPRRRRGFAFGGFVLVFGSLLLTGAIGQLPDGFWFALLPMWPVLLIAPGLNLVLSRVNVVLGSAAALVVLGAAVSSAWMMARPGGTRPPTCIENPCGRWW